MGARIHHPLPLRLRHCSPSASVANLPASATVPSPTLPLYSISLIEPHRGDSPASPTSSSSSPPSTTHHRSPLGLRRRQPRLSHRRLSPALSLSLLLDPPSASLHYIFHRRSPPRSPPLSTVGRLPLLPLRCTPISATTIVTTLLPLFLPLVSSPSFGPINCRLLSFVATAAAILSHRPRLSSMPSPFLHHHRRPPSFHSGHQDRAPPSMPPPLPLLPLLSLLIASDRASLPQSLFSLHPPSASRPPSLFSSPPSSP